MKYGMSTCIGETISGLPFPVFYDPNYPALCNKSPVTLVTGGLGSGKTFFGLTVAAQSSILGKTGIILDPKGDFTALKMLEKKGCLSDIHIWNVSDSNKEVLDENAGMLDPTCFGKDTNENTALTIDTIKELVGELSAKQQTYLTPIVRDIVESDNPTFLRVATKLLHSQDDEIRALGYSLDTFLKIPLAKLLVKDKRIQRKSLELNTGFVVVNLMGLQLPPDTKAKKDYKATERISVIIMGLLCQIIINLMQEKPKSMYKTLIIDEAWAVVATESGNSMLKHILRLCRSLNMAVILLTQSTKHFGKSEESDINTLITERFAFRNMDEQDNLATTRLMKLPEGEGWEQIIYSFHTGECLMQDSEFNIGTVQILVNDTWAETFSTTPVPHSQSS